MKNRFKKFISAFANGHAFGIPTPAIRGQQVAVTPTVPGVPSVEVTYLPRNFADDGVTLPE